METIPLIPQNPLFEDVFAQTALADGVHRRGCRRSGCEIKYICDSILLNFLYNGTYRDPWVTVSMGLILPGGASFSTGNYVNGFLHFIFQTGSLIAFPIFINNLNKATAKETALAAEVEAYNLTVPIRQRKAVPKVKDRSGAIAVCYIGAIGIPSISKIFDIVTGYNKAISDNRYELRNLYVMINK